MHIFNFISLRFRGFRFIFIQMLKNELEKKNEHSTEECILGEFICLAKE